MAHANLDRLFTRLRLAARYRLLSAEAAGRFRKLARWVRMRAIDRKKRSDEDYEEPWLRDMVERS